MFTGIIEEVGRVISAQAGKLNVAASAVLDGMKPGDSIAVNGACLTVTGFNNSSFSVSIMAETLERTNLGLLSAGDRVNLERPLTFGGRLGGHLVQGHVDNTGKVASINWQGEAMLVRVEAPIEIMNYVVEKGFIAVDGASLTIVTNNDRAFVVSIVEYTRTHTIIGSKRIGELVNLEVDIIAKYVEQFSRARNTGITPDFLQEHGFSVS